MEFSNEWCSPDLFLFLLGISKQQHHCHIISIVRTILLIKSQTYYIVLCVFISISCFLIITLSLPLMKSRLFPLFSPLALSRSILRIKITTLLAKPSFYPHLASGISS